MTAALRASKPTPPRDLAAPALRGFFRLAELWELSVPEQATLLGVPRSTLFRWRKTGRGEVSRDTLERISYLLGIYKALQILLPERKAADAWIRKPNDAPPFGGRSALERMLAGQVADLYAVRRYLDAERGG